MNKIVNVIENRDEGYEIIGDDGTRNVTGIATYNFKIVYRNDDEVHFKCVTDRLVCYKRGDVIIIDRWGNIKRLKN